MSDKLLCYRCGASLSALTPPLSRQDECPSCENYLHVCKMCVYFDPDVPRQCREDDAEEVIDKEKVNFCEWFKPSSNSFDEARKNKEDKAKTELVALFDAETADPASDDDDSLAEAKDLFR